MIEKKGSVAVLILAAIIFLLGITPVGIVPLGVVSLTILHIPVIVGSMTGSKKSIVLLGLAFGLSSCLTACGISLSEQSGLAAALMVKSPVAVITASILPRLFIPITTRLSYDGLKRRFVKNNSSRKKMRTLAVTLSTVIGSLTNTVLYLGTMGIFFAVCGIGNEFITVFSLPLLIGIICELLAAIFIANPVVSAVENERQDMSGISIAEKQTETVPVDTIEDEPQDEISSFSLAVIPATDTLLPELNEQMQKRHDRCIQYLNEGNTVMASAAFDAFSSYFKSDEESFRVNMYITMRFIEASKYKTAAEKLVGVLKTMAYPTPGETELIQDIMRIIKASIEGDANARAHTERAKALFLDAIDFVTVQNCEKASECFEKYLDETGVKDRIIEKVDEETEVEPLPIFNNPNVGLSTEDDDMTEGISGLDIPAIHSSTALCELITDRFEAKRLLAVRKSGKSTEDEFEKLADRLNDDADKANVYLLDAIIDFEAGDYAGALSKLIKLFDCSFAKDIMFSEHMKNSVEGTLAVIHMIAKNLCESENAVRELDKVMGKAVSFFEMGAFTLAAQMLDKYFLVSGLAKYR